MAADVTPITEARKKKGQPEEDPPKGPSAMSLDPSDERLKQRFIPTSQIVEGANARSERDPERQKELNASVKVYGILQPVRVRPLDDGTYQLVAGSRRFIAAKANRLEEVPAVVASATDQDAYVQGLVENVQREDLDPIDEARGFQQILSTARGDGKKMTQAQLAVTIGKSQPYISNAMRLLNLPDEVLQKVQSGDMTVGAAKAIVSLPKESQARVAKAAVKGKYTTQQVESEARSERARDERATEDKKRESKAIDALAAAIREGSNGKALPEDATVLVYSERYAKALNNRKLKVTLFDHQKHQIKNGRINCRCKGLLLEVQPYKEPMATEWSKVCLVRDHVEKAMAEERAKAEAEAKVQIDSVNEARTKMFAVLEADPELRERYNLYTLYSQPFADYQGPNRVPLKSFRERWDVPERVAAEGQFPAMTDIWATILGMPIEKVRYELIAHGIQSHVPNVYADRARHDNLRHAELRQWWVDNHGVDQSIVWGGHEPLVPVTAEQAVKAAQEPHDFVLDEEWVAEARGDYQPDGDMTEEEAEAAFQADVIETALCKVCLAAGDEVDRASHDQAMAVLKAEADVVAEGDAAPPEEAVDPATEEAEVDTPEGAPVH